MNEIIRDKDRELMYFGKSSVAAVAAAFPLRSKILEQSYGGDGKIVVYLWSGQQVSFNYGGDEIEKQKQDYDLLKGMVDGG